MDKLTIFDTTLRDGEQAPGCSMILSEKLKVGRMLAELGVDVIEAGFPAASDGDFESVSALAAEIEGPVMCGLARCKPHDIERAWAALEPAKAARLHVFIATSPVHREHKLGMSRAQVLEHAVAGVKLAHELCTDVEFSAEDALRTERDFLVEVFAAAIEAGATTINIPDTVGYTVPGEIETLFRDMRESLSGPITLSAHCHDDLGLAAANSLAAVRGGARQVECTINGIGERAGNCPLEEIVMAVRTRADYFGVQTGIDTTRLHQASRLTENITGCHVARNKAIVGANAFAHEAGIHQHGMLKNAETYEIMRPQDVGVARTDLVLGKHSGRHAFTDRVADLGFELDETQLERAFNEFKSLADRKKTVFDSDIEAIVLSNNTGRSGPWRIELLQTTAGSGVVASAAIALIHDDGTQHREAAVGNGPIHAAFRAIERAVGIVVDLDSFEVHNISVGEDAMGEVNLSILYKDQIYRGQNLSTDIVEASAIAFLQAINRIVRRQAKVTDATASIAESA